MKDVLLRVKTGTGCSREPQSGPLFILPQSFSNDQRQASPHQAFHGTPSAAPNRAEARYSWAGAMTGGLSPEDLKPDK